MLLDSLNSPKATCQETLGVSAAETSSPVHSLSFSAIDLIDFELKREKRVTVQTDDRNHATVDLLNLEGSLVIC